MRLTRQHWGQLPSQAPDAAFEIGDAELSVDDLLQTGVKNNGRTGRDRCYTRV